MALKLDSSFIEFSFNIMRRAAMYHDGNCNQFSTKTRDLEFFSRVLKSIDKNKKKQARKMKWKR